MNEKYFKKYWIENVKGRVLYRTMSSEYIENGKTFLDPTINPFEIIREDLFALFSIVIRLERLGVIFTLEWKNQTPSLSTVMKISLNDFFEKTLDFTTSKYEALEMSKVWQGGALATNINKICQCLQLVRSSLTTNEQLVIDKIKDWADLRQSYKNVLLTLRGNSISLETAIFQHREKEEGYLYWECPFGRFTHFHKLMINNFDKYDPYLKGSKHAYIRVKTAIPEKDINIT